MSTLLTGEMLKLGNPIQMGWVVNDLYRGMLSIGRPMGISEWTLNEWPNPRLQNVRSVHRGIANTAWKAKMAVSRSDNFEIELIESVAGESCYSEWIREHGQSIHHLMYRVDDVAAVLASLAPTGLEPITTASVEVAGSWETRWAVVDTSSTLGINTELISARGFN